MAEYVLIEKSKIVSLADAIRETTGTSDELTLNEMILALGGTIIPDEPDTPVVPDEPDTPSGLGLAPGMYQPGALQKAHNGDASASSMLVASWDELKTNHGLEVSNGAVSGFYGSWPNYYGYELVLDSEVTAIQSNAFDGDGGQDNSITACYIPATVTSIGRYAFNTGSSTTLYIESNDNLSLDTQIFGGWGNSHTIFYYGTEAQWNAVSKADDWDGASVDYMSVTVTCIPQ